MATQYHENKSTHQTYQIAKIAISPSKQPTFLLLHNHSLEHDIMI